MRNRPPQTYWITGASSGIGEALSLALNRRGERVILSARRANELERVRQHCAFPDRVCVLPLDLSAADTLAQKTEEAVAAFGSIDVLIHNGGISQRSRVSDTALEVDRRLMEVNFFGTVALTKALLPHFVARQAGHFVIISSLVGKFGTPLRSAYAASKHALHGFFDSLRAEHHHDNLRVTMVCPGFVRTQVSVNALTGDGTRQNKMDQAQKRGISPEKCARQTIRAIDRRRQEVYIGGKEVGAVYVKRFFPRVFAQLLRRAKVT